MTAPTLVSWFYVVALSFLVAAGRFDEDLISSTNRRVDSTARHDASSNPKEAISLPSFLRKMRRTGTVSDNSPKHHQFNRRLGPFISGGLKGPKRGPPHRPGSGHPQRVHHHPYMEQPHHPRGRPNRRQQYNGNPPPYARHPRPPPPTAATPPVQQSWPVQNEYDLPPPPPTIADPFAEEFYDIATTSTTQLPRNTIKRKLLLPIISGGYASTSFQGGNRKNPNSDNSGFDGEEIALQVVSSNDLSSFSNDDENTESVSTEEDEDTGTLGSVNLNVVEQANVSEIPKLSWSSTTTNIPPPSTEKLGEGENSLLLSESPYFPSIPQVAPTDLSSEGLLTNIDRIDDEQDIALTIKDKLTDIFNVPEQNGMYDERKDLLAAQTTRNDYFSVDLATSFGGKPSISTQDGIITKQEPPRNTDNEFKYVGTVEEVPLFNGVDFSSSNTRKRVTTQAITTTPTTTTSTTTTTPNPYILQPGSAILSTNLEEATSITEDQLEDVDDKEQYVRFVASPPKQINIHIPAAGQREKVVDGAHSISHHGDINNNNLDASGHFAPTSSDPAPYSPFYQLGYHSTVPGENSGEGRFPGSIDPSLVDPNIYHEDRPTLPQHLLSSSNKDPATNIYPLGKAPPKNEDQLPALLGNVGKGPTKRKKTTFEGALPSKPEVRKPKPKTTSFFDFLIPSFLSGRGSSNRADPEGPTHQPKTPQEKPDHNGPNTINKLPVPTRPPNTFPDPQALGGRLNPILIKVPNGFPPQGPPPEFFPKPPSLEDWENHAQQQQKILAARSGSQISKKLEQEEPIRSEHQIQHGVQPHGEMRDTLYAPNLPVAEAEQDIDQESNVISNEIVSENINYPPKNVKPMRPLLKLPIPPPPMASLPIKHKRIPPIHPPKQPVLQKTPLPMTSQPVIGLPRVPLGRKQAPFLMGPKQKPLRPPVLSHQNVHPQLIRKEQPFPRNANIPQRNSDYMKQTKMSKDRNEEYLAKLRDPEFVQNLTRSYVFHHTDPSNGKTADVNRNVVGQGPVSYVPQAPIDPFFFRPEASTPKNKNTGTRNNQIITKANIQKQSGFTRHELPPLDLIAPQSRPVSSKRLSINNKPEVVYRADNKGYIDTNPLSYYERRNTIYKRITTRRPIYTTIATEPTTSTESITTTLPQTTSKPDLITSTTTNNPIAEHISSLLKQYLSTDAQNDNAGVPTLLYDDDKNTVILEYASPDGEKLNVQERDETSDQAPSDLPTATHISSPSSDAHDVNIARVDEGSDTLIATEPVQTLSESSNIVIEDVNQINDILLNDAGFASYLAHLQEQKEGNEIVGTSKAISDNKNQLPMDNTLINIEEQNPVSEDFQSEEWINNDQQELITLPHSPFVLNEAGSKKTFKLDQVFEPSATPTDSDWFILDESGKRRRTMSKNEIEEVKHIIEESINHETDVDHTISTSTEKVQDMSDSTPIEENVKEEIITEKQDKEMFGGFQPVVGLDQGR